ncbi:MAG: DUF3971 domain-containing protein [Acetobacteraceae bacterium]|nr:DUF3971 domain-containing protein [Acetobacteraceae bacterium]
MTAGQARAWLHRAAALLIALPLLLGLLAGAAAWRLAQGPVELPFLAGLIEDAANPPGAPSRVEIGRAAVAWEGWRGGAAPVDIRLTAVRVRDAAGAVRAELPDAAVALSLRALLRGAIAPSSVELREPRLHLTRDEAGAFSLGFRDGAPGEEPSPAEAEARSLALVAALIAPADEAGALTTLRRVRVSGGRVTVRDAALGLDWALQDPHLDIRRGDSGGLVAQGRAVLRVAGAEIPVSVTGQAGGAPARAVLGLELPELHTAELAAAVPVLAPLSQIDAPVALRAVGEFDLTGRALDLRLELDAPRGGAIVPRAGGRIAFERLSAALSAQPDRIALTRARLDLPGGVALTGEGRLSAVPEGWSGAVALGLGGLTMAELAAGWPQVLLPATRRAVLDTLPRGALSAANLRLQVTTDAEFGRWTLDQARVEAVLEQAALRLPRLAQPVPVRQFRTAFEVAPAGLRLEEAVLRLRAGADPQESVITLTGGAWREGNAWRGRTSVALDRIRFTDLAAVWPEGVGGGERDWLTRNVTAGEIRDGAWEADWRARPDFEDLSVARLAGQARVEGATVHWMRPIPPVRNVAGRASFSLDEITVQTEGGRQEGENGQLSALEVRGSTLRFLFPNGQPPRTEMQFALAGSVADTVAVIRHPRLRLFERRPFPVRVAAGTHEGRLTVAFPLVGDLTMDRVRLRAETRIANGRLTQALLERDLEAVNVDLVTDQEQLRVTGAAVLAGIALRVGVEMDFRQGPANQVVVRESASGRADAAQIAALGFGTGGFVTGPVAIEARTERRRNGQGQVQLRADLRDATLALPALRWAKPPGSAGQAEAMLRLNGDALTGLDSIRIEALELLARGRAQVRQGRVERVEIQESVFGGSRFTGDAVPPRPGAANAAWAVNLRGPTLDLRPLFGPQGHVSGGAARDRLAPEPPAADDGVPLSLTLGFDQALLGAGRDLFAVQGRLRTDAAGVVREAQFRGRTGRIGGPFEIALTPRGEARLLRVEAEDGGALLRAAGLVESIGGGRLTLAAQYADSRPGAALTGTAELDQFTVRNAPALGKLLQAVTLFGLVEAVQGGSGLAFARAIVPFTLTPEELRLNDARAFSASLGLTARGRVLRERTVLDLEGTIVPAYILNSMLGNIPLLGRIFSPETGGGVFAATFRAMGPPEDAQITVNPLAALTPGFLRGLFQLGDGGRPAAPAR